MQGWNKSARSRPLHRTFSRIPVVPGPGMPVPGLGLGEAGDDPVKTCQRHGDAGPGDLLKMGRRFLEEERIVPRSPWPSRGVGRVVVHNGMYWSYWCGRREHWGALPSLCVACTPWIKPHREPVWPAPRLGTAPWSWRGNVPGGGRRKRAAFLLPTLLCLFCRLSRWHASSCCSRPRG